MSTTVAVTAVEPTRPGRPGPGAPGPNRGLPTTPPPETKDPEPVIDPDETPTKPIPLPGLHRDPR